MFVTRFAPSPTGFLHLGHAYSALSAARAAERAGGRFILRIEDIDLTRCRPEYEAAIYEDLEWLGLEWEEPVRRQSEHFADYERMLESLIERRLVYRCFKTRKEILDDIARAPHLAKDGPEGQVFFGAPAPPEEEARLIADGAPFAWRLSMKKALAAAPGDLAFTVEDISSLEATRICASPERFGDVVLARKDLGTSYHLAAVHDDALQGVTHVIRGEDLRPAAHLHRLLQALVGIPTCIYRHHRLVTDDTGRRLAKRDRAATLRELRAKGLKPNDILQLREFYAGGGEFG
jgi:glutamyl-Q tRNA(Asp) synthetase